jgi:nucleoid DNA-binding protein
MKIQELIATAKAGNETAFGNIPDKRAAAIVRAVLNEMAKQVREAEAPVAILGFGRFIVRQKEVEKDGQKVMQRRIAFRPAAAKTKKAVAGKKLNKAKDK